jgi:hypothetical protein
MGILRAASTDCIMAFMFMIDKPLGWHFIHGTLLFAVQTYMAGEFVPFPSASSALEGTHAVAFMSIE